MNRKPDARLDLPMPAVLRALSRDRRGAVLPVVAMTLSVLIGAGAVAVDASRLYVARGDLQKTADASARSAAWEVPGSDAVQQTAGNYAAQNMNPDIHGTVLAPGDAVVGSWSYIDRTFTPGQNQANAVRVTMRQSGNNANAVELIFARVFGPDVADVSASAVATQIDITACVLSLAPAGTGLEFNGGVSMDSQNCGLAANSLSPDAALIANGGSGNALIESLYLAGGLDDPHRVINSLEPPIVHARRQLDDPYADRNFNDFPTSDSPTWNTPSKPNTPVTLEPGVYPTGMSLKGDVTLQPGVYVAQGDVNVGSQANVYGDGVTIIMDNADMDVAGGSYMDLTAPATGSTAGIAIMRQGPPSSSKMTGGSGMTIEGAVYMPNSDLRYAGNSAPGGCLQVIAQRITFSGDTSVVNDGCQAAGAEPITMQFTMLVD